MKPRLTGKVLRGILTLAATPAAGDIIRGQGLLGEYRGMVTADEVDDARAALRWARDTLAYRRRQQVEDRR